MAGVNACVWEPGKTKWLLTYPSGPGGEGRHLADGGKWGDGAGVAEGKGAASGLMYPKFHYPKRELLGSARGGPDGGAADPGAAKIPPNEYLLNNL